MDKERRNFIWQRERERDRQTDRDRENKKKLKYDWMRKYDW